MELPRGSVKNRLLAALQPSELESLLPELERVAFRARHIVFRAGDLARYVYFPQEALISLLATMEDGRSTEVALTGGEGIVGIAAVLGAATYRYTAAVVVPGSCIRMRLEKFKAKFERDGDLQFPVLNYFRYLFVQVSQTAACNRLHRVRHRLARRLLMIQDRVCRNEFPMTHESLAIALGTPRPEVSFAAEVLRHFGMIDYSRGRVVIVSREQLESLACECYGVIHHEFLSLN
jgi:CRP-like cAMP-binding protein